MMMQELPVPSLNEKLSVVEMPKEKNGFERRSGGAEGDPIKTKRRRPSKLAQALTAKTKPSQPSKKKTAETAEAIRVAAAAVNLDLDGIDEEDLELIIQACSPSSSDSYLSYSDETTINALSSNSRASRNQAEKHRRDNLNKQIATMAMLVPSISEGLTKKRDKISVLRLTSAYMRLTYTLGVKPRRKTYLQPFVHLTNLEDEVLESLVGATSFLCVLTTFNGKIVYISKNIERLMGHDQLDMLGESVYDHAFSGDHDGLREGLRCEGLEFDGTASPRTGVPYKNFQPKRATVHVRLAHRGQPRKEEPKYDTVMLTGLIRLADKVLRLQQEALDKLAAGVPESELPAWVPTSNDVIFIATGHLSKRRPHKDISILDSTRDEYFTRHLIDGRIIYCDHRISTVTGYMTSEVSGASAFKYMHRDDASWTIVGLRLMYDQTNTFGSSCYRLKTKTGAFIYLRTFGYLEYDNNTNAVCSFLCINTLVSPEEGEKLMAEMKNRFAATMRTDPNCKAIEDATQVNVDGETASDPQIAKGLTHLMTDLPLSLPTDFGTQQPPNTELMKACIYSKELPPASEQARQAGIMQIENLGGKGKSVPASPANSVSSSGSSQSQADAHHHRKGDKVMPELDALSALSPISNERRKRDLIADKVSRMAKSPIESLQTPIVEPPQPTPPMRPLNETCRTNGSRKRTLSTEGYEDDEFGGDLVNGNKRACKMPRKYPSTIPVAMPGTSASAELPLSSSPFSEINNDASDFSMVFDVPMTVDEIVPNGNLTDETMSFDSTLQMESIVPDASLVDEQYLPCTNQQSELNGDVGEVNGYVSCQENDDSYLDTAIQNNPELLDLFSNLPVNFDDPANIGEINPYPTNTVDYRAAQ
ncbi:hypoxia-inducible factor 3-alpha-like isoform X2 [Trichogramma pretiosum]|uniref:hypoxia-inducible factor 3-alpha-like isoform X2 n=1 Tax=Trichogramma pretiosum TaxID=7493 RepID=UPI0006C9DEFE|nr:hypoxia-inducible factor 3-alpha-like isoform X2 [Trichogramma pretiosum]